MGTGLSQASSTVAVMHRQINSPQSVGGFGHGKNPAGKSNFTSQTSFLQSSNGNVLHHFPSSAEPQASQAMQTHSLPQNSRLRSLASVKSNFTITYEAWVQWIISVGALPPSSQNSAVTLPFRSIHKGGGISILHSNGTPMLGIVIPP